MDLLAQRPDRPRRDPARPHRIEESFGGDTGLDLPGLGLISAAAFGIVWGLVRGNAAGWDSLEVVGALAAGVLLVGAFIARERRAPEPMLPMRFFRSRAFSAGNAAIFLTFASLFGAVFFFAQMLQTALGYGPLDAGLRLIPWTITFITVAPVVGALADRFGERPFMVGGLALQALGMGWVALIADPGLTYSEFVLPSVVAGIGVSMAIPAAQNSVVGSFALEDVGKAAGANSMMRELGGVFGIAVAVAVFAGAGSFASADAFLDGFAPAIAVVAALSLAGAIVALALPGRRQAAEVAPVGASRPSRGRAELMSKLQCFISMSLDGFVAGSKQSAEDPLGVGGLRLHEWTFLLAAFRETHGEEGGGEVNASTPVVERRRENIGAVVMGRNMFGGGPGPVGRRIRGTGSGAKTRPTTTPVYVLTHHAREPQEMEGGTTFHFVTDGIESALEQAKEASRGKDVSLAGGANVIQQCLAARLLDEIEISLVPILLGKGERLFDNLGDDDLPELAQVDAVEAPGVAHLRYRLLN